MFRKQIGLSLISLDSHFIDIQMERIYEGKLKREVQCEEYEFGIDCLDILNTALLGDRNERQICPARMQSNTKNDHAKSMHPPMQ